MGKKGERFILTPFIIFKRGKVIKRPGVEELFAHLCASYPRRGTE